jgi:hypothetical protein
MSVRPRLQKLPAKLPPPPNSCVSTLPQQELILSFCPACCAVLCFAVQARRLKLPVSEAWAHSS